MSVKLFKNMGKYLKYNFKQEKQAIQLYIKSHYFNKENATGKKRLRWKLRINYCWLPLNVELKLIIFLILYYI